MKLLAKCNEQLLIGTRSGPCPDLATSTKLAVLASKLVRAVNQRCGGADKTCDGNADESLGSIGRDIGACPGFEGGCTGAIDAAR